jgi:hypothetical protein
MDYELATTIELALRLEHVVLDRRAGQLNMWFFDEDPELALNIVDALLEAAADKPWQATINDLTPYRAAPVELERLLALAGSSWRVADDGRSLERRVDETVAGAAATAATPGTSASQHLAEAWKAAYGRRPDPSQAYSEAIKAVEAAAAPVITPNDRRATLGTIRGALRSAPDRWNLAIQRSTGPFDATTLDAMLTLLWEGQTDRHGGINPTVPIELDAAQAAVHLAATLVQWFESGAVRPAPIASGRVM